MNNRNNKLNERWKNPSIHSVIYIFILAILFFIINYTISHRGITFLIIPVIILFILLILFIINLRIKFKHSLKKTFYNIDYKKIIKIIDASLEYLNIQYTKNINKKSNVNSKVIKEKYYIKNKKFKINVVLNITTVNSVIIVIKGFSKNELYLINKFINEIDKRIIENVDLIKN